MNALHQALRCGGFAVCRVVRDPPVNVEVPFSWRWPCYAEPDCTVVDFYKDASKGFKMKSSHNYGLRQNRKWAVS